MSGARAVHQSVIEDFPEAGISISIIWIDVLRSDNERAAVQASKRFGADPRVKFFYDPNQSAGQAFTRSIEALRAGQHLAWDIYMFYEKHQQWEGDTPPAPEQYLHQLSRRGLEFEFRGEDLVRELHKAVKKRVPNPK